MNGIHKKIIITIEKGKFYKFAAEGYTIQTQICGWNLERRLRRCFIFKQTLNSYRFRTHLMDLPILTLYINIWVSLAIKITLRHSNLASYSGFKLQIWRHTKKLIRLVFRTQEISILNTFFLLFKQFLLENTFSHPQC